MTKFFAAELAMDGIRVNCVCPGRMLTNIDESYHWDEAELAAAKSRRGGIEETGLRTMGHPREVAYLHLFLNCDESSFVTGTALVVDGIYGRTRNPLYLGMILVYLGLSVAAGSLWAIVLVVPLLWVINVGVIAREERYLERKFGDAYRAYKGRVRRWV